MANYKSEYYRFTGTAWDLHYFKTSADLIVETSTYKVLTADERTRIAAAAQLADTNQRLEFGGSTQYIRLAYSSTSKLFIKHGGGAEHEVYTTANLNPNDYLAKAGGTMTGSLIGTSAGFSGGVTVGGVLKVNGVDGITSDNDTLKFTGLTSINFSSIVLKNLGAPVDNADAATKAYVDAYASVGTRPVAAVKVATTTNVTLSGLTSHDGYTLQAGDRILVWKQTTASQNGIYAAASGAWTRIAADSGQGAYVFVEHGTAYNDWYFYCRDNNGTWIDSGRPDTIAAGAGLSKSGTTISVPSSGITNAMLAGSITHNKLIATAISDTMSLWTDPSFSTSGVADGLTAVLNSLMSAIKLTRGTASYKTDNTQNVAGAYTLANSKIKSEIGANVPGTGGYVAGDLFFRTLSTF